MEPNDTSTNTDPVHGTGNGIPPVHGTNSTSQGDKSTSVEELQRQFAELQAKHAEILADNQKYRKERREQETAEQARKAQEQAKEEQQLREQNQYKELAEKYGTRVKELEPVQERFSSFSATIAEQIKAQTKDWPKEVKDLLPSDDTPIETRYAQIQKLQAFVDKLNASTQPQTRPGNAPNPKPASPTPEGLQQRLENQLRASGKYRA